MTTIVLVKDNIKLKFHIYFDKSERHKVYCSFLLHGSRKEATQDEIR